MPGRENNSRSLKIILFQVSRFCEEASEEAYNREIYDYQLIRNWRKIRSCHNAHMLEGV